MTGTKTSDRGMTGMMGTSMGMMPGMMSGMMGDTMPMNGMTGMNPMMPGCTCMMMMNGMPVCCCVC